MPDAWLVIAGLALLVTAPTSGALEDVLCNPLFVRDDLPDDVVFAFFLDSSPPSPALDILQLAMTGTDDGLRFEALLAGDPREEVPLEYWYWLELPVDHPDDDQWTRPQWTMQSTFTYDAVTTMNVENPPEYRVTWNGTAFSFVVPWNAFSERYGDDWPLAFFDPMLVAQGPHTPGPVSQQFVGYDDRTQGPREKAMFYGCQTPEAGLVAEAGDEEKASGVSAAWFVAIGGLVAAACGRTRARP